MEILAQKLAEVLDISVQKAVELYPILRVQYQVYYFANGLSFLSGFLLVLSLSALVFIVVDRPYSRMETDYETKNEDGSYKKVLSEEYTEWLKKFKFITVATISLIAIIIACMLVRSLLAPDIILIKSFI